MLFSFDSFSQVKIDNFAGKPLVCFTKNVKVTSHEVAMFDFQIV